MAPEVDEVFSDPAFTVLKTRGAAFAILRPDAGEVVWANEAALSYWSATDAESLASAVFGPTRQGGGWIDGIARGLVPGRPPRLVRGGLGRGFRMRAHTALIAAVPSADGEVLLGVAVPDSTGLLPAEPQAWRRPAWPADVRPVEAGDGPADAASPVDPDADRAMEPMSDGTAGAALARRSQVAVLRDRLNKALDGAALLRLVWRTDESARVTQIDQDSFTRLASPLRFADGPLPALLAPYDPAGAERLREALASRETWSGLALALPVADGAARVPLVLSAAPVFGPERRFAGFRGFGTIDLGRLDLAPPPAPGAAVASPAERAGDAPPELAREVPPEVPSRETPAPDRQPDIPPAEPAPPTAFPDEADHTHPAGRPPGPTLVLLPPPANVVHLRAFQAMVAGRSAPVADPVAAERPDDPTGLPEPGAAPVADAVPEIAAEAVPDGLPEPTQADAVPASAFVADVSAAEAFGAETSVTDPSGTEAPLSDDLAFLALGEALRARIGALPPATDADAPAEPASPAAVAAVEPVPARDDAPIAAPARFAPADLLDRLPMGLVVVAGGAPVFANAAAVARLGHATPADLIAAGEGALSSHDARPIDIVWEEGPATLLVIEAAERPTAGPRPALAEREEEGTDDVQGDDSRAGELLDRIEDAVALLDGNGLVRRLNRRGESWFGGEAALGHSFTDLLAPDSRPAALALLGEVRGQRDGLGLPPPRREVLARTGDAPSVPMMLTLGRLGDAGFYLILRDVTALRQAETERDRTERDHAGEADRLPQLLGKVSHEIRTPLNAILGFAEVMMDERFGPLGNPRYRDYLKDIHASGSQVMALVEDLLDLSRIEAGQLDLDVAAVDVNRIVTETVAQMQPEAHRERVIMRTSLGGRIPPVLADERSARQIVRNLLSNAVKFNEPGGQVIVSTALGDSGAVLLRVRDTGVGMTDEEIAAALEPFGGSSAPGQGNGLGLPVTRALVGANGASMAIRSRPREGTLVEIAFVSAGPVAATRRPA